MENLERLWRVAEDVVKMEKICGDPQVENMQAYSEVMLILVNHIGSHVA